jgi:pilus assembly protein Flp/PilA
MLDYLRIMLAARLARKDERGASAVEYGLLVAGIAGIIVLTVFVFGAQVEALFQTTCDSLEAQRGNGAC